MPNYRLYYFNLKARGELARLIFHYAGIEFADCRIEFEEWSRFKSKMPFSQIPVLEVDGQMLAQSNAICRYLARQYGLAGKNPWEEAMADMYVDCIADLVSDMKVPCMEKDTEKQNQLFEEYLTQKVLTNVESIERHLENNGSRFLVGDQLTWADLAYYSLFDYLVGKFGNILVNTPHLKGLVEHVANIPALKKWIEIRPQTEM